MAATAAAAKLRAADCNNFDAGFSEQGIGISIAVISHYYSWFQRDNVVAVIPLLALRLICIASCLHDAKIAESESFLDHLGKGFGFFTNLIAPLIIGRIHAITADLIHDFTEDCDDIAIAKGEHCIEMHGGAALRHEAANYASGSVVVEKFLRDLQHSLSSCTLSHAYEHDAFADRHDVSAFQGAVAEVLIRISPPDVEVAAFEHGMEFVDGALQQ
jgi:hypothetical protein